MTWRSTTAWEFCQHGLGGPGTRLRPKQGVQVVQRWILAALRKRQFFSLAELNEAIAELLVKLNQRPFRKLPGSRAELYQTIDRPALQPLPVPPFVFAEWKKARVNHRLSRGVGGALLQHAVSVGGQAGGDSLHGQHGGDPVSRASAWPAMHTAARCTATAPLPNIARNRISSIWNGHPHG